MWLRGGGQAVSIDVNYTALHCATLHCMGHEVSPSWRTFPKNTLVSSDGLSLSLVNIICPRSESRILYLLFYCYVSFLWDVVELK